MDEFHQLVPVLFTPLAFWLACPSDWLSQWPLNPKKGRRFWKHCNKRNRTVVPGLLFSTLSAATLWETSSGFSWQSGNRFTIWFCAKPASGSFVRKCVSTIFPTTTDMMKCYKGHQHPATENVFYNFPHHLTRSQMSTKSIIGIGCEAIKNGWKWRHGNHRWETDSRLQPCCWCEWQSEGESERERVSGRGWWKKGELKWW